MPIPSIKILPTIRISSMTVENPSAAVPIKKFTIVCIPSIMAKIKNSIPDTVIICIGRFVKLVTELNAYLKSLRKDHFVLPAFLGATSNSIRSVLKPTQQDKALKKVSLSGIALRASTTFLSISL